MRSFLAAFQLSLLISALCSVHPPDLSPFILALDSAETIYVSNGTSSLPGVEHEPSNLLRRQNCAANYNYCSTIVSTAVCCSADAICSQDNAGNAACCPTGSYCTGTIPISSNAAAVATTTNLFTTTSTSTSPLLTTASAATGTGTALPSYVPNAYNFPFAYAASTFSNAAACTAAYSSCATEYTLCTVDLQGGAVYGVTIAAPGGGVTVAPNVATSLPAASAVSVCSSLSSVACPGGAGTCAAYGTVAAATATTTVVVGAGSTVGSAAWSLWAGAIILSGMRMVDCVL